MPNKHFSKRIAFPVGKQNTFILKAQKKLAMSNIRLAVALDVSVRTFTDWKREKFTMSIDAAKKLSRMAKISLPKGEIKTPFWYTVNGSSAGGVAVYKKYGRIGGDPAVRKKRWREWWEKEGKFKSYPSINAPIPINKPKRSEDLAEFVGIVLGDGGITERQITVTLHRKDDAEYSKFVITLIKKLFDVPVSAYYGKKSMAVSLVVSRSELVRFCTDKLGLRRGNKVKQQVDIPSWIKRNKKFRIACLRGLVDTDGCVFTHRYKVNGKLYAYKKMSFTNHSKPLVDSVYQIMKELGFKSRISREHKEVRLDNIRDVKLYLEFVGSHNSKHLKRYKN